mgnify:FL=1
MSAVRAVEAAGFTHLVWIPDSHLGPWEADFPSSSLAVVRPTREGEAVGVAAGLLLGGARPLVAIQCTGLFEAGDAVRNAVYDMGLPVKLLVGVRGWRSHLAGPTVDTCPRFAEPFVKAWGLPFDWHDPFAAPPGEAAAKLGALAAAGRAAVLLWAEP